MHESIPKFEFVLCVSQAGLGGNRLEELNECVHVEIVAEGRVHAGHVVIVAGKVEITLPLLQFIICHRQFVDP